MDFILLWDLGLVSLYYSKMKILALDIGTKRIGVAKASTLLKIATPITTINRENLEKDIEVIKNLVLEHQINQILLGLPITLSGKEEHSAKYVRKFGELINKVTNLEIIYWDERFSSVSAERVLIQGGVSRQKRKGKIDQIAATIFLQNYLDSL